MTKHYALSTITAIIVGVALVLILFLIMLPQVESLSTEVVPQYSKVDTEEFEFVETKHFVTEILSKKYSINSTDINNFTNNNQYKPGNYDPFTPDVTVEQQTQQSTNDKANQNTQNSVATDNKTGNTVGGTQK